MCRQDPRVHLSPEEQIAAEESLSIYCKPVELYNILQRRAVRNVTFSLPLSHPMTNAQFFVYLLFSKENVEYLSRYMNGMVLGYPFRFLLLSYLYSNEYSLFYSDPSH